MPYRAGGPAFCPMPPTAKRAASGLAADLGKRLGWNQNLTQTYFAASDIINKFEAMKHRLATLYALLGILLCLPGHVFANHGGDSLVVDRLFAYKRNFAPNIDGVSETFYLKYTYRTARRNPTLFFVPSMYSIAKGSRDYIGENIGKITFRSIDDFKIEQKTIKSTVPHNRQAMDVMMKSLIPDLYGVSLFGGYMLSPFNYSNRIFYRYRVSSGEGGNACITFRPKLRNTQLVEGFAIVDKMTGRIVRTRFRGEYDMISFEVNAAMGDAHSPHAIVPVRCDTRATFKFMGNKIHTRFFVNFDCPLPYPGGAEGAPIDSIRPTPLEKSEEAIYNEYFAEETTTDTVAKKESKRRRKIAEKAWDAIDDYLLSRQGADLKNASVTMSPLFNPLYMSYSNNRGLAYKMDIGARYSLKPTMTLTLKPRLGYNFKIRKFFFNVPLRYTIDSRRDAWVELAWANGNRITNSSVLDIIKEENRDTIDFSALDLDYFDDESVNLTGNTRISRHVEVALGFNYHRRTAVNEVSMRQAGKPTVYNSFAPFVKLTIKTRPGWPVVTANYERSQTGIFGSNIKYERWEFDASMKRTLHCLRQVNVRLGGGFYTNKSSNYFVDFGNFHENYIPGGWNDDMAGDFQLLNSEWYNASRYYVRLNTSYSSPLLLLTWIPMVGKYIESERIYVNHLLIAHTRPYTEIGYGLTNRYFSVGIFGSILGCKLHEFGSKFTFELFSKW